MPMPSAWSYLSASSSLCAGGIPANRRPERDTRTPERVFRNVRVALDGDGIFLFDLNQEDESEVFGNSLEMVEADHVCVVRASYKPKEKLKRYDATMFTLEDATWRRSDLTLFQRYYDNEDVLAALAECGFSRVKAYDARREFGFTLSDGRMFYLARK